MRFVPLFLAAALTVPLASVIAEAKAPPEPDTYIFDVLPLQPYKGTLARLVSGSGIPDWVKAISATGEGTAVPAKTVDIGGTPYRLDHVCKPHDCAGNTLDVLWAPVGHKAWAVLVDGGKPPLMLGDPPPAQAKALMAVVAPAGSGAVPPAAASAPETLSAATAASPAPPSRAAAQEPDPYIFDVLALQPYRGNFARLAKAKGLPDWVAAIVVKGEGTATPAKTIDIGGTPYRLDHVCKPHDCAGNTLDVLWSPAGRRVWAALVDAGQPRTLLGKPPAAQAKVLADTAAPSAAAVPVAPTPVK